MNRDRLKILKDHLVSLPNGQVDMSIIREERDCGTVACIGGWADVLWPNDDNPLGLTFPQRDYLFTPRDPITGRSWRIPSDYTRLDAIAALQSLIDNPDDNALPVWPKKAVPG